MSRIILLGEQLNVAQARTIAYQYDLLARKLIRNRGKSHASVVLKEYYNILKADILGCEKPKTSNWCKLTKTGFPKDVHKLIKFMDLSNVNSARWALSLFSLYETWKPVRLKADIETLSTKENITMSTERLDRFKSFIKLEKSRMKRCKMISKIKKPENLDYLSMKGGPNGQATLSAHHDALKLSVEKDQLQKLQVFHNRTLGLPSSSLDLTEEIMKLASQSETDPASLHLLKTIAIPDKGPKVRTITIGNYYLQRSLKVFHNALMETLRNIPEDGTYRQSKAAQSVKLWTSQGKQPWCFDLTSATDLFPIKLQYYVLKEFYPEVAYSWYEVLRNCKSYCQDRQEYFEFGVGQPMGLYTSWAAFALTHHILVRFAFSEASSDFRHNYYIIGDDIAILCPKAAAKYEELILSLGISISRSKSITPLTKVDKLPSAELAKRYFRDGVELTPVRPYQLESLNGRQWHNAIEFFRNLIDRWGDDFVKEISHVDPITLEAPFLMWVDKIHRKKFLLLSLRPPLVLPVQGVTSNMWWPEMDDEAYKLAYDSIVDEKYTKVLSDIQEIWMHLFSILGVIPGSGNTMEDVHPFTKALTNISDEVLEIRKRYLSRNDMDIEYLYLIGINISIMLTIAREGKSLKDYQSIKLKRSQALAESTLELWARCVEDFGYIPNDSRHPRIESHFLG